MQNVINNDLNISHFATEPTSTKDIYFEVLNQEMPSTNAKIHKENIITKHTSVWRQGDYIKNSNEVMNEIKKFCRNKQ